MNARRFLFSLSLFAFLAMPPDSVQASELLREDLSSLAEKITVFLKAESVPAIAVGNFSGPPALMASSGPGIKKILGEEFSRFGITVDRRAPLVVKGDYGLSFNQKSTTEGYIFGRVIRAEGGQILFEFRQPITRRGAAEQLIGGTSQWEESPVIQETVAPSQPGLASPPAPSQPSTPSQGSPSSPPVPPHLQNGIVFPKDGSPYGVEILVGGVPRPPKLDEEFPFVEIGAGETYAVRLWNHSDFDAAVRLTVDGISMFAFNESGGPLEHVVVPKGRTVTVPGWFMTLGESMEFKVTGYPESAAATVGIPEDEVGMVTAVFAAAWKPGQPGGPPSDEFSGTKGGLATGFGEKVGAGYQKEDYEIGKIRAAVTIRYTR
jgi:hypothetical protein